MSNYLYDGSPLIRYHFCSYILVPMLWFHRMRSSFPNLRTAGSWSHPASHEVRSSCRQHPLDRIFRYKSPSMQFHHYLIPAADLLHVWDVLLFPDYSVLLYLQMDPVNLPYTHFLHEYEIQKILRISSPVPPGFPSVILKELCHYTLHRDIHFHEYQGILCSLLSWHGPAEVPGLLYRSYYHAPSHLWYAKEYKYVWLFSI